MVYIGNEKALLLEESMFKARRLPLFHQKYIAIFGEVDKNKKIFLNEISWFFNLCKYLVDWKSYYSKETKAEKKNKFIKKIISEYGVTEFKAKEIYNDLYNIYEEVYKELVSNISLWNVFKGVFISLFILGIVPLAFIIYIFYGNKIMDYLVNLFNL